MSKVKNGIFLAKYSLIKPKAVDEYKKALQNQYLSKDELEKLNWNLTKQLLDYAYEKVPFYKKRFKQVGLQPGDIKTADDYSKVPVLTRKDLQDYFNEIVSEDARPEDLRLSTTGGSTGEPVKVYHQKKVVRAAMGWRMLSWWGMGPGDDFASIYRDTRTDWKAHVKNALTWWPTHKILLDAVHLNKTQMDAFIKRFNRIKPKLLHGYVGAVDHLATYILENQLPISPPKAIWVTSAVLTSVQESRISKAFGAPVYDQYGSCEMFWLAAECPAKSGLHIFYDTKKIEFLDDNHKPCNPEEMGNIAVTDLENMYFPLIRYLNGDRGRSLNTECPCGVNLPLMDKVKGRATDKICLPDGSCIAGDYLTTIFDDYPDFIKQFQVHQQADSSLNIYVIPERDSTELDPILGIVGNRIRRDVGGQVPVKIIKTVEIQQSGGKLRFVRSDLN